MKSKIPVLILTLIMILTISSCGGAPAPGSSPSDTPAAATSDYDYLLSKGSIIIGYTVYEPMNYTDSDGNFTGFDTELSIIVCGKLGLKPEFVEINWDTKEIELAAKSIDCIWNGLTITDERKENMSITIPYVKNAQVVVMKIDAEYTGLSSLAGKTVCAEAGSAGEETIQEDEVLQTAAYVAKELQTACLMEVAAGTADAAVLDLTLARAMIGEGTNYRGLEIKERLAVEDYGVAFRRGSNLSTMVNNIFNELVRDGTMSALAEKYGLDLR